MHALLAGGTGTAPTVSNFIVFSLGHPLRHRSLATPCRHRKFFCFETWKERLGNLLRSHGPLCSLSSLWVHFPSAFLLLICDSGA